MYHYIIRFSYIHVHIRTTAVLRVATPPSLWPEGGVVVLHVKQCLQTCFVAFILVPYHTHIQSFSFITCSISQLCAQICPYYNVWPGAVYCCFNKNYNVYKFLNMTLHAGLANPTCLQSFTVWYCSVYELRESNSKKKKMKNIGAFGRIGIFYLTPFPCTNLHTFLVSGVIRRAESHEAVKFHIHLILKLKQ